MWSEEEQRDITDYEVEMQTVICPACSSRQSKYKKIRERGDIPTVYDSDKVVEQLEKEKNPIYRSDGSLMAARTCITIDKAIEIVKGGGVDA